MSTFSAYNQKIGGKVPDIKTETYYAVKTMNAFDEMNCEVYRTGELSVNSLVSIDRFISSDYLEE